MITLQSEAIRQRVFPPAAAAEQELRLASHSLFAHEIILERCEEVADHGDAPGAAQNFLPLHATHVVDVSVVFGEAKDPANTSNA